MAADSDCIFCQIAAGDVPSVQVARSDHAVAFMDIGPIADGHTLVIPRKHYATVTEMPADEVAALFELVGRVAPAVQQVAGAEGLNLLQNNGRCAGQLVGHVHVHLIPRHPGDGLQRPWPAKDADREELKQLGQAIAEAVTGQ